MDHSIKRVDKIVLRFISFKGEYTQKRSLKNYSLMERLLTSLGGRNYDTVNRKVIFIIETLNGHHNSLKNDDSAVVEDISRRYKFHSLKNVSFVWITTAPCSLNRQLLVETYDPERHEWAVRLDPPLPSLDVIQIEEYGTAAEMLSEMNRRFSIG